MPELKFMSINEVVEEIRSHANLDNINRIIELTEELKNRFEYLWRKKPNDPKICECDKKEKA